MSLCGAVGVLGRCQEVRWFRAHPSVAQALIAQVLHFFDDLGEKYIQTSFKIHIWSAHPLRRPFKSEWMEGPRNNSLE